MNTYYLCCVFTFSLQILSNNRFCLLSTILSYTVPTKMSIVFILHFCKQNVNNRLLRQQEPETEYTSEDNTQECAKILYHLRNSFASGTPVPRWLLFLYSFFRRKVMHDGLSNEKHYC